MKRIIPKLDRLKRIMRWERDQLSGKFIVREAAEHMVVEHCNLWCKGCDHASPDLPVKFSDVEQFAKDIAALKKILRVRTFKLLGGEPLLHPDIISFARIVKASGIARSVEVWTNGLLVHEATADLFDAVDLIHVSRYPGVRIVMKKARMDEISRVHGLYFAVDYTRQFRQTHLDSPNHNPSRNQEVFRSCKMAHEWSCHTIHDGYYFKCSLAEILRRKANIARSIDGVPLHAPDLRKRLDEYLASPAPLASCAWCLGSSGASYPHRQLNKSERTASTEKRKTWIALERVD